MFCFFGSKSDGEIYWPSSIYCSSKCVQVWENAIFESAIIWFENAKSVKICCEFFFAHSFDNLEPRSTLDQTKQNQYQPWARPNRPLNGTRPKKPTCIEDNDEKTTKFCTKLHFSSFCRRFRRFVIVFFVFISFRRLGRLLSVRNDCFFVGFLSFHTLMFFKWNRRSWSFFALFRRFLRRFFFKRNCRFLIVFSSFNCSRPNRPNRPLTWARQNRPKAENGSNRTDPMLTLGQPGRGVNAKTAKNK